MFMVIENDDDREFIAALYESKRKLWVRKAYALTHDWQTAEDMVSDSFVKLIDKIELLRSLNCYKADAYVVIIAPPIKPCHKKWSILSK
ncbi:RNA polymerase sigma factor [Huintestinicola sp.]